MTIVGIVIAGIVLWFVILFLITPRNPSWMKRSQEIYDEYHLEQKRLRSEEERLAAERHEREKV